MSARAQAGRFAAAALLFAASFAQAGGPAQVCNGAPVRYNPSWYVHLHFDQGALGSRTKAQADAIVTAAIDVWQSRTSGPFINREQDLAEDVTAANFVPYFGNDKDLLGPVIYDSDGSIIDALLGTGARESVVALSHAPYSVWPSCSLTEASMVISGFRDLSDNALAIAVAHEIGHLIGLDHSQLDGEQGLAPGDYPLMYPIVQRESLSLHEDDFAAVSALYPASVNFFGELSGTLVMQDGVTPVRGANVWATETTTGRLYSGVSDWLGQGTGDFRLLLPTGNYRISAGAIHSGFSGGSSVGQHAATATDASFQPPLHVAGSPMAPVTMGGPAPAAIAIVPNCRAEVVFRLDGTGTVDGNCNLASFTSPLNGAILDGASQVFSWSDVGAERYQLQVGSRPGGDDLGYFPGTGTTGFSTTVTGLPVDGRLLYVRLWSVFQGVFFARDYVYTASTPGVLAPAIMVSPPFGTPLTGVSQAFTWTDAGASTYRLSIGSAPGATDVGVFPPGGTTGTTTTVTALPDDGRLLFVRLHSTFGAVEQYRDYAYSAHDPQGWVPAAIYEPAPGSTLSDSSVSFRWVEVGSPIYELLVGSAPGSGDIGSQVIYPQETAIPTATVTNIPRDGRTLHVRLYSYLNGALFHRDATYTAPLDPAVVPAGIASPADGETLSGPVQVFTWNSTGASTYRLSIGSWPGDSDVATIVTTGTSATLSGLPTDGRRLYVSLMSTFAGIAYGRTIGLRAAAITNPVPAELTYPPPGTQIFDGNQRFEWNLTWAPSYELRLGSEAGAGDYGVTLVNDMPQHPGQRGITIQASGLPTDGRTVHARLVSIFDGIAQWRDYVFDSVTAPPPGEITSPAPGSVLTGDYQEFTFSLLPNRYYLTVGSTPGGSDLGSASDFSYRSRVSITSLPVDGRTLHVRLYSTSQGAYSWRDYTYTAFSAPPLAAGITSPPSGSELTAASQTFAWNGTGTVFALTVGSSVGAWDYGVQYTLANSVTVGNLPRDGRALYVRLYTQVASGEVFTRDHPYTAFRDPALPLGLLTSPSGGTTLTSPRQEFRWGGTAAAYLLIAGSAPGGWDLGVAVTSANAATLSGLPVDGRTIHVRLYSLIDGVFYQANYSFKAHTGTLAPAAITSPANGAWLRGASQTLVWSDAMATLYQVWVGNAPGTNDLGTFPPEGTASTSATITGLPMDGRTFYVRLWSFFGSTILATDYAYRSIP